ncbi:MAG: FliH/SctL family protein [Acidobacteriota bacterium]
MAKKSRVEGVLEQLGETIESLATTRAALFHSAQSDVLRLAMAIARRILHRELLISPDALGGIIVVVLERLEDQDVHRVRVHPSMVVRIEELLISRTGRRKVQVVSDETLSLGGCVFETQHGAVNAGIESQLSEIERGLADQLEGSR